MHSLTYPPVYNPIYHQHKILQAQKPQPKKSRPEPIKFCFRIRQLKHEREQERHRFADWYPPRSKNHFEVPSESSATIYYWQDGTLRNLNANPDQLEPLGVASVYWQNDFQRFISVNFDATQVSSQGHEWCKIEFSHDRESQVSQLQCPGEFRRMCTPCNDQWIRELIPENHNYDATGDDEASLLEYYDNDPAPGGLSGDLTLIIAFAAFSCSEENLQAALIHSFRRGSWIRHGFPHGRE
jgi:hypothetical protein